MPCYMYEKAPGADFYKEDIEKAKLRAQEATDKANQMADILCSLLRTFTPEQIEGLDERTRNWFKEHIEHDEANGRPYTPPTQKEE